MGHSRTGHHAPPRRWGSRPNPSVPLFLALALVAGCDSGGDAPRGEPGITALEIWAHAGQEGERRVIQEQVARFNASQREIRVAAVMLPEGSYNAQVQAAALAGDLPDLLEFDGPFVYNYAWQGHLAPLGEWLSAATRNDLLPSIREQGMFRGEFYAVGTFDSGLALFARRSALRRAAVRIPGSAREAWDAAEFDAALAALAAHDADGAVLDLKLNQHGEWYTYAFAPLIQSAGGDLIDRATLGAASGVLNGPAAAGALRRLQAWIARGYVDPNVDDGAFVAGRVALAWGGHWDYRRYAAALGDDLAVLPLPDFGRGARTGQGSWSWGMTRNCAAPEAAARFLEFLLQPAEVLAMADANGAVPATRSAIARSPLYRPGGPLRLFADQLETIAVPRPQTPAYPIITSAFQRAFADIRDGGDVQQALDRAAAAIDQDIRDNKGYPPHGR